MDSTKSTFRSAPKWVQIQGDFDESCTLQFSPQTVEAGERGHIKFRIQQHGAPRTISNAKISLKNTAGNISIFIGLNDAAAIFSEDVSGAFDLRLWRKCKVEIGRGTTSNGVRIIADLSEVIIGEDCMFSDDILIQSSDQHGIVDLTSGEITNNIPRHIHIGDHVWIGRRSTLMPDISIGNGSIIGAGAIVTKNIPQMAIAVGVPAKVVKTSTTWSRSPIALDSMSRRYVNDAST